MVDLMRIFARRTILDFCERHPAAKQQALAWHDEAAKATWANPQDIKNRYASASFVGGNRVVFNLKGDDYRSITAIAYRIGAVSIKFIGTHTEYDKVEAETVEME
jgi:mRNA interferase HigB